MFTAIPLSELLHHIEIMLDKKLQHAIKAKPVVESETLMTVEEVGKFLKVSKVTIHKWKKQKRIKSYRIGRRIYFKKSDILDF